MLDNRYKSKKIRIMFTVATILWMLLIFSFSMEPGNESTETSSGVTRFVARIFISDFETWPEKEQQELLSRWSYPVRKFGHLTEYAVLGFFAYGTFYSYGFKRKKCFLLAFSVAILYACSDEIHQYFIPGRDGKALDVCIDSIGSLIGILLFMLCNYFIFSHFIRKVYNGNG